MRLTGRVSWFGGPADTGVAPDEGLAFIDDVSDAPHLFLPTQPPGTTGLARRLDPQVFYLACRWDYDLYPKPSLLEHMAWVRSERTGRRFRACPADWGPNENTGRIADISPGLMEALGITTDDEVTVTYPGRKDSSMDYDSIVVSGGHGKLVRGASGLIDEYTNGVLVSERLATELRARGCLVPPVFHDTTSTNPNDNLAAIVDYHNSFKRDLDVSVHFNSNVSTSKPVGTECLYLTQEELAAQVSAAVATSGLIDRGAVYRDGLYFLNQTDMPAILIEVCFVDSEADVEIYHAKFPEICSAIADVLVGEEQDRPERPERPDWSERQMVDVNITSAPGVEVRIHLNGEELLPDDEP